jgi:hypothetical protein
MANKISVKVKKALPLKTCVRRANPRSLNDLPGNAKNANL